jgi:hypothetical protein
MPPVGFELTIPQSARPQTHALDRAATGIGVTDYVVIIKRACAVTHNTLLVYFLV